MGLCNIHFDHGEMLVRVEDFRAALREGKVTSDDGNAYWATETHYCHEHPVFKSRRRMTAKPAWAVGIAWFPHHAED